MLSSAYIVDVMAVPATDEMSVTTTLKSLGHKNNRNIFLSVGVISAYNQNSGGYVTVKAVLDDGSKRSVVATCAPPKSCQSNFFYCAANVNLGLFMRSEGGGSIQLVSTLSISKLIMDEVCLYPPRNASTNATTANGLLSSPQPTSAPLMGPFVMKYVLTTYLQPTMMPTPLGTQKTVSTLSISATPAAAKGAQYFVPILFGIFYGFLAAGVVRLRDTNSHSPLALLSPAYTIFETVLLGASMICEFFYMGLLLHGGIDIPRSEVVIGCAAAIIVIRLLHAVPLTWVLVQALGTADDLLETTVCYRYMPLYGCICLLVVLDVPLMKLLPWKASVFAASSGGYPSLLVYRTVMTSKVVQQTCSTILQAAILIYVTQGPMDSGTLLGAFEYLNIIVTFSVLVYFVVSIVFTQPASAASQTSPPPSSLSLGAESATVDEIYARGSEVTPAAVLPAHNSSRNTSPATGTAASTSDSPRQGSDHDGAGTTGSDAGMSESSGAVASQRGANIEYGDLYGKSNSSNAGVVMVSNPMVSNRQLGSPGSPNIRAGRGNISGRGGLFGSRLGSPTVNKGKQETVTVTGTEISQSVAPSGGSPLMASGFKGGSVSGLKDEERGMQETEQVETPAPTAPSIPSPSPSPSPSPPPSSQQQEAVSAEIDRSPLSMLKHRPRQPPPPPKAVPEPSEPLTLSVPPPEQSALSVEAPKQPSNEAVSPNSRIAMSPSGRRSSWISDVLDVIPTFDLLSLDITGGMGLSSPSSPTSPAASATEPISVDLETAGLGNSTIGQSESNEERQDKITIETTMDETSGGPGSPGAGTATDLVATSSPPRVPIGRRNSWLADVMDAVPTFDVFNMGGSSPTTTTAEAVEDEP
jgi:hypothetical protein